MRDKQHFSAPQKTIQRITQPAALSTQTGLDVELEIPKAGIADCPERGRIRSDYTLHSKSRQSLKKQAGFDMDKPNDTLKQLAASRPFGDWKLQRYQF